MNLDAHIFLRTSEDKPAVTTYLPSISFTNTRPLVFYMYIQVYPAHALRWRRRVLHMATAVWLSYILPDARTQCASRHQRRHACAGMHMNVSQRIALYETHPILLHGSLSQSGLSLDLQEHGPFFSSHSLPSAKSCKEVRRVPVLRRRLDRIGAELSVSTAMVLAHTAAQSREIWSL